MRFVSDLIDKPAADLVGNALPRLAANFFRGKGIITKSGPTRSGIGSVDQLKRVGALGSSLVLRASVQLHVKTVTQPPNSTRHMKASR